MNIETIGAGITVANNVEEMRAMNIDNDFWIFLAIALVIGAFGGLSSYMSKMYHKKRDFSPLDFLASIIIGAFGGMVGITLSYSLDLSMPYVALIFGIFGSISMTLLRTISDHKGDILRSIFKYIFKK